MANTSEKAALLSACYDQFRFSFCFNGKSKCEKSLTGTNTELTLDSFGSAQPGTSSLVFSLNIRHILV